MNKHSPTALTPIQRAGEAEAFLPNLCSAYALFLWVLAGGVLALMLTVTHTGLQQLSWATLGLVAFEVQWVLLLSAALLCQLRFRLAALDPVQAGLMSYGLVLLCALLVAIAGQWLLQDTVRPGFDGWQVLDHVTIAAMIAAVILRFLYLQQQLYHRQQSELNARIQALQSRIQPHFLFNSMNSIASLISTDPPRAERVVENLSDLFRASLAGAALVPLERELSLCRSYLDIEQLRLDTRLQVQWELPDTLPSDLQVPGLLLQPLVENAIRHGIEPDPAGGEVHIRVHLNDKLLRISVTNTRRPGHRAASTKGNQIALANIRHRLKAHYGKRAGLRLAQDHDAFTAMLVIDRALCESGDKS